MERDNPLGVDRVHKLIIRFSVPAIVGMVVNSFYNIVDRIFIGNEPSLGTDGLAAITIFFPFMIFLMAIGILFGVGGATYFAIRLGEGKPEEAEKALGNTLSLLVLSGLFFMILGQIFLQPLLVLFGASESVLPYAIEYARIILFGASLWAVSMGMNNMIRADGNPRIAMVTMFISAGSNIVLDALFIYGFKMGMSG
ncbi:MAG: MATE family efflux transporter, partial [Clostridiaceae bacterium]|nr:MATE family efflux transporter [Clostridiaceae bacterium]